MVTNDMRIFRFKMFLRICLHDLLKSELRTVGNGCLFMTKTIKAGSYFSVRSSVKANRGMEMKEKVTT